MHFEDTATAAEAAAESAKQAIAAAQAAAYLANKGINQDSQASGFDHKLNASSINHGFEMLSGNSTSLPMAKDPQINHQIMDHQAKAPGRIYESPSFDGSQYDEKTRPVQMDGEHVYRRHSYNGAKPPQIGGQNVSRRHSYNEPGPMQMSGQHVSRRHGYNDPGPHYSDIKFDESDCDEEIEMEHPDTDVVYPPPERAPPPIPSSHVKVELAHRVHPKLPDYDSLAARFEALKYHKSQT